MDVIVAGLVAGALVGIVLRRADLCYHSMFRGLFERRYGLFATWALGVGVAAVGLSLVYAWSDWDQLNEGLPFHPVRNIVGGLTIGVGMVVALSCASGLFYKLGAGMLGAVVGLAGWIVGELITRELDLVGKLPGTSVLDGGEDGTLPGVLGVSRFPVALVLLVAIAVFLVVYLPRKRGSAWAWPVAGVALGAATVAAWALAGWASTSFGPGTVGTPSDLADWVSGDPLSDGDRWQALFLLGIIGGSLLWSVRAQGFWLRGEDLGRLGGLAVGGALLGAGGLLGGGCNLGHGLSGVSQMSIGSYVAVASMAAGVGAATAVRRQLTRRSTWRRLLPLPAKGRTEWRPSVG